MKFEKEAMLRLFLFFLFREERRQSSPLRVEKSIIQIDLYIRSVFFLFFFLIVYPICYFS